MQKLNPDCGILIVTSDLVHSSKKGVIRVLHVDDDLSMLEISKQILMDMGNFEIVTAFCVDEAFKKLSTGQFDVVISDYEMPQKNGLQFLESLRDQRNGIPFILFTGKGREEVAINALNLGADGYINKTGDTETVYGELAHCTRQSVEKKCVEQALRESDIRLKKLSSQASGMLYQFVMRPNGTFCVPFATEAIRKIFGCSPKDVREDFSPIAKVILPEDLDKVINSIKYSAKHLTPWLCEYRVQIPGQEIRWMWGQSIPEKLADGEIIWHGYNVDVTERKKLEATLQEKLDTLEVITENIGAGLVTISKDYRVLYANKFVKNKLGNVEGKTCYSTLHTLDHICPDCGVKKVFEDGVAKDSHEYSQVGIDGKPYFVEIIATPLKDKEGNATAALEFAVDIAEKKRMQQKMLASEAKFRAINEFALDAIFLFDEEDRIAYWNPAAERIFGYLEKEVVGEKVNQTLVPPRFRRNHLKLTEELARANNKNFVGEIQEFPALRKDGAEFSMELSMAPLQLEGKQYFVAIARDITERKKAKRELQESEARYRCLFEQAPLPVAITALDGTMLDANVAMQTFTGYSLKELKKTPAANLYEKPQDRKTLLETLKRDGVASDFFTRLKRKDGNCIDVILNVSNFQIGKVSFMQTTIQDVTERKKAEEALNGVMDQLVLVNEKLGVVGSLTRHDVRNKLSAVSGYAYLLKKKHADQADIVDGLGKMEEAVKDSMKIFDFAKMYEQLGIEELTYIDVEKTINEAVTLFSGFNLKVVNDCQKLTVLADSFLRQLFYNFIDNTRKYGKKTTAIRVHFEKTEQGELRLIYEDDGVGISAENKPKLFSEGFSTGCSTGFGLFLIKKMIDVYGWTISEKGAPGKGVKFLMTIPTINSNGKKNYFLNT